jgi:hypothetical protein
MALRSGFALHHSEFGEFLSAPIWDERNGNPLSVLSALARLDIDPWAEAARLADLPKEAAAVALAAIISRLPENHRGPSDSDTATIAARLVKRLPEHGPAASVDGASGGDQHPKRNAIWLICLMLAAVLIGMAM